MSEVITIRRGSFEMALAPQQLPQLRLSQVRGIFKLMQDSGEYREDKCNARAIRQMQEALRAMVLEAKEQLGQAICSFQMERRNPLTLGAQQFRPALGYMTPFTSEELKTLNAEIRKRNAELQRSCKKAKACYERTEKIQNIFRAIVEEKH